MSSVCHRLWLNLTLALIVLITDFSIATSEEETFAEHAHSSLNICLSWNSGQ